jgi:hypothetical protein
MHADPREQRDLSALEPELAQSLAARLERVRRAGRTQGEAVEESLDEELLDELEELGYAGER